MTNYEKIKTMSIDKLSELFSSADGGCYECAISDLGAADYGCKNNLKCKECARHWLEQEENKSEDQ
ncbi:MAG: hypothetical protein M0R51_11890 [Clostridia bacterium]|jgi:hypothetical protein|nr:hypothetical protein [Clostridia bacterium]